MSLTKINKPIVKIEMTMFCEMISFWVEYLISSSKSFQFARDVGSGFFLRVVGSWMPLKMQPVIVKATMLPQGKASPQIVVAMAR